MKKDRTAGILGMAAGLFLGLIFGCLITWFPIRLLYCSAYHTPDCEEIVLVVWPFYCFLAPLIGGVTAGLLYRRRRKRQAGQG